MSTIQLLLIGLLAALAICSCALIFLAQKSSEGYQDESGFHFGAFTLPVPAQARAVIAETPSRSALEVTAFTSTTAAPFPVTSTVAMSAPPFALLTFPPQESVESNPVASNPSVSPLYKRHRRGSVTPPPFGASSENYEVHSA